MCLLAEEGWQPVQQALVEMGASRVSLSKGTVLQLAAEQQGMEVKGAEEVMNNYSYLTSMDIGQLITPKPEKLVQDSY